MPAGTLPNTVTWTPTLTSTETLDIYATWTAAADRANKVTSIPSIMRVAAPQSRSTSSKTGERELVGTIFVRSRYSRTHKHMRIAVSYRAVSIVSVRQGNIWFRYSNHSVVAADTTDQPTKSRSVPWPWYLGTRLLHTVTSRMLIGRRHEENCRLVNHPIKVQ